MNGSTILVYCDIDRHCQRGHDRIRSHIVLVRTGRRHKRNHGRHVHDTVFAYCHDRKLAVAAHLIRIELHGYIDPGHHRLHVYRKVA